MTQGPLNTPTGSGLAVRTGINDAIMRLATKAAGVSRPADIATYEEWLETDNPGGGIATLWLWDGTSDIFLGLVNTSSHLFVNASVLTTQGDILYRGASGDARLAAAADAYKALFSGGAAANPSFAGTWKVLGEITSGGGGSIDVTGIPAAINQLMMLFRVLPATDATTLRLRTAGADGNFDTGGTDYNHGSLTVNNAGTGANTGGTTGTSCGDLSLTNDVNNDGNGGGATGVLFFSDIQAAVHTRCLHNTSYLATGANGYRYATGNVVRSESDRITGVRLYMSSGNISGRMLVLGATN